MARLSSSRGWAPGLQGLTLLLALQCEQSIYFMTLSFLLCDIRLTSVLGLL